MFDELCEMSCSVLRYTVMYLLLFAFAPLIICLAIIFLPLLGFIGAFSKIK